MKDLGKRKKLSRKKILVSFSCREYTQNFWICEMQKLRKYMCQRKNNHTRQYLRGLTICLRPRNCSNFTIFREKYKMRQYSFFSQNNSPNLNLKTMVFHSCTHDSQLAKHGPKFFPTKPKKNLCSMDTNAICSTT